MHVRSTTSLNCHTLAVFATLLRPVCESSFWTSMEVHEASHNRVKIDRRGDVWTHRWSVCGSSNDLVHPIVVWVVTIWSKVNTTTTTAAGALMRDATKCRCYTSAV